MTDIAKFHMGIEQPPSFDESVISSHTADLIEVSFKDQFVSRRDMWKITQKLNHMTLHKNKQVEIYGFRFKVRTIYQLTNSEG